MPTQILNVTFDGSTEVDKLPGQGTETWGTQSTPRLDHYSVYLSGPDDLDATANLAGSNWRMNYLRMAGDENKTTIRDLNGQEGRRIDYVELGYNSDVDLITTQIRAILGWDGEKHDIKLGNKFTATVDLGADVNLVQTGAGYVGRIDIYDGRGTVTANGDAGIVNMASGNDRLIVKGGQVFSASMQSGNDIVVIKDGGRIDYLSDFGGTAKVSIENGSRLVSFRGGDGAVDISLSGTGNAETLSVYEADFKLRSADGYINTIQGWQVSSDIVIGDGGTGGIKFTSDTAQTHKIKGSDGFIASIDTSDSRSDINDDQSANIELSYFAGSIRTGHGKDKVMTGDGANGYVETIFTSGGNDIVIVGSGGAGTVSTNRGDDAIRVKDLFYTQEEEGVVIRGGAGVDVLNFTGFSKGVTFSLNGTGKAQEVAEGSGFFSEFGIENLNGSSKNDKLIGDKGANVLSGRNGADTLIGGDQRDTLRGDNGADKLQGQNGWDTLIGGKGNDILNGGRGNDNLTGNAGADIFVFQKFSGTDSVQDFQDGTDKLRLVDHTGGFGDLTIADAGNNLKITHDNGMIVLSGQAGTVLTSADFEFV